LASLLSPKSPCLEYTFVPPFKDTALPLAKAQFNVRLESMDSQALAALIDSASSLTVTRHFTRPYFKTNHHRARVILTGTPISVAGCVVLLWDHLLTFGDEIEYIWRLPVEFSKLVFLFNRYFVAGCLCCSVYGEFADLSKYAILAQDCSIAGIACSVIPGGKPARCFCRKVSTLLNPLHRCTSSGHLGYYTPLKLRQMS